MYIPLVCMTCVCHIPLGIRTKIGLVFMYRQIVLHFTFATVLLSRVWTRTRSQQRFTMSEAKADHRANVIAAHLRPFGLFFRKVSETTMCTELNNNNNIFTIDVSLVALYIYRRQNCRNGYMYPLVSASRTLLRTCIRRHVDGCKLLVRDTCIRHIQVVDGYTNLV